jgi:hypothetical protein
VKRLALAATLLLIAIAFILLTGFSSDQGAFWAQWGRDPQHSGMVDIAGQPLNHKLADIIYDPFVAQEQTESGGDLLAHYQATLVDGTTFYMILKSGTYPSCQQPGQWIFGANCGPNDWQQVQWNVTRYDWQGSSPTLTWTFPTDWKPEPNATNVNLGYGGLFGWEPVFHPALANGSVYVPGAGGTVYRVNPTTGQAQSHINPFPTNPPNTFISGPLTVDANGNIFYNVIQLNTNGNPWQGNDVVNAWLVKITPSDTAATVTYATLTPGAPAGGSNNCQGTFFDLNDNGRSLPWPPSQFAHPPTERCGSQRPPVNVAPAVAPDGTVYTVSVAHFDKLVSYMVAVNPDLTLKWSSTMQNRLNDGCGVLLPIAGRGVNNLPNSCRFGTFPGVDPTTNNKGSANVGDQSSSTPTVLPDGGVLFGANDMYDFARGHLFHFDSHGNFVNSYTFGWDSTPAVYQHDGTWSIIVKDNHYPSPAYCGFNSPVCTSVPEGPYLVSQLDANLHVEWSFKNTNFKPLHPNGYEWCVNAPTVDANGLVYITSEDGAIYTVPQGHQGIFSQWQQKMFLKQSLGAAYTPLSIGPDGKVYSQNDGHLFVVGQ